MSALITALAVAGTLATAWAAVAAIAWALIHGANRINQGTDQ